MVETLQDQITRVATFPRPIEQVWTAITSPESLVHWMCSAIEPFRLAAAEIITFSWENEQFRARIVTVEPPRLFVWQWYPGAGEDLSIPLDEQGPLTTVTFALDVEGESTRLTLTETGFAALSEKRNRTALAENNVGWDECLALLEGVLGNRGWRLAR